jgi:hypothetical protein
MFKVLACKRHVCFLSGYGYRNVKASNANKDKFLALRHRTEAWCITAALANTKGPQAQANSVLHELQSCVYHCLLMVPGMLGYKCRLLLTSSALPAAQPPFVGS